MKVKAKKTEYLDVDISESDLFLATSELIRSKCDLGSEQWVRDDGVLMDEVDHPHRAYDEEKGPATPMQIAGYKLLKSLMDVYYGRVPK